MFNISEAAASIIDCHDGGQNPMASNSPISRSHTMTDLKKINSINCQGIEVVNSLYVLKIDITRGKIE